MHAYSPVSVQAIRRTMRDVNANGIIVSLSSVHHRLTKTRRRSRRKKREKKKKAHEANKILSGANVAPRNETENEESEWKIKRNIETKRANEDKQRGKLHRAPAERNPGILIKLNGNRQIEMTLGGSPIEQAPKVAIRLEQSRRSCEIRETRAEENSTRHFKHVCFPCMSMRIRRIDKFVFIEVASAHGPGGDAARRRRHYCECFNRPD